MGFEGFYFGFFFWGGGLPLNLQIWGGVCKALRKSLLLRE